MSGGGFRECATCAAKKGSPILCESCLANRKYIEELERDISNAFFILPGRVITLDKNDWTHIPPSRWPDEPRFNA